MGFNVALGAVCRVAPSCHVPAQLMLDVAVIVIETYGDHMAERRGSPSAEDRITGLVSVAEPLITIIQKALDLSIAVYGYLHRFPPRTRAAAVSNGCSRERVRSASTGRSEPVAQPTLSTRGGSSATSAVGTAPNLESLEC